MNSEDGRRTIRSVERAITILEQLSRTQPTPPSSLSDRIDLTPGAIHTQLATLQQNGYVTNDDGEYSLGPQLLTIGRRVRNSHPLYEAGREEVDKLADETGECAHAIIEFDGQRVPLYEAFGQNAVGTELYQKKQERPQNLLHCTASGKALLSTFPDERVEQLLDIEDLRRLTDRTITDPDALFEELETIRERGYATNDEEEIHGIRAIGVPIHGPNGRPVGALSVSGPTSRLEGTFFTEELPERLLYAQNVVEISLQTSPT